MSDFLSILLIMVGVGTLILLPTAYFGGKIGVIIATLVLITLSCYFMIYAKALGKSFANSNSPMVFDWEILIYFIGIALLYSFLAYSAFSFSQVAHGVDGYKIRLIVFSLIIAGLPTYLYSSQVYQQYRTQRKNYTSKVIIAHPKDFPIQLDYLEFIDSKSKKTRFTYSYREDYSLLKKFEGLREQNEHMSSHRYYATLTESLIPIGFDSFVLAWYSLLENRFYKDTFKIDQKKFKVGETYDGQLTISNMLITILPDGNVDLLKIEYSELFHQYHYHKVEFTATEGQSIDQIGELFTPFGDPEYCKERIQLNNNKRKERTEIQLSAEEILSFRKVYNYGFDITINQKPDETNHIIEVRIIDFYLNQYTRSAKFLKNINEKPLPSLIELSLKNDNNDRSWIRIAFNKKAVFNQFITFLEEYKEEITFEVNVNIVGLNKTKIYLRSKDHKLELKDWHISE